MEQWISTDSLCLLFTSSEAEIGSPVSGNPVSGSPVEGCSNFSPNFAQEPLDSGSLNRLGRHNDRSFKHVKKCHVRRTSVDNNCGCTCSKFHIRTSFVRKRCFRWISNVNERRLRMIKDKLIIGMTCSVKIPRGCCDNDYFEINKVFMGQIVMKFLCGEGNSETKIRKLNINAGKSKTPNLSGLRIREYSEIVILRLWPVFSCVVWFLSLEFELLRFF